MSIKVIVAEDHPFFRMGVVSGLKKYENIEIICEAKNGLEVMTWIETNKPADILLLDLHMPGMSGYDVLQAIKGLSHPIKTIVVSMAESEEVIPRIAELGAHGYVSKDDGPDELHRAIECVLRDEYYFTETGNAALIRQWINRKESPNHPATKVQFAPREIKIIECIIREMTNEEIARDLYISVRTVESIRSELIHRVGAKNAIGLIAYAYKNLSLQLLE